MTLMDVKSIHVAMSPRIVRDRIRIVAVCAGFLFLVFVLLVTITSYVQLLNADKEGAYRTDDDMINGGKRFLDYLYSMNSRSVAHDQQRSIAMILNADKAKARSTMLAKRDFIRDVERAGMKSEIDWLRADVTIMESDRDSAMKLSISGRLIIDSVETYNFHMILYLVPTDYTDENPSGVGILDFIDMAEEPFFE